MKHYFAICDRVIDEKYAMLLKTVNLLISNYINMSIIFIFSIHRFCGLGNHLCNVVVGKQINIS